MKKLPESEQEIMMIIWEYEEPVSLSLIHI